MASIPSGSKTLFIQEWTPVGWTRDMSYADCGLRVTDTPGVDGTTGSDWTSAVASSTGWQWSWPATINSPAGSLTVNPTTGELAAHTHGYTSGYISYGWSSLRQYPGGAASGRAATPVLQTSTTSGSVGQQTPDPHTHPVAFGASPSVSLTVSMQVKYVDAILATRN